MITRTCLSLFVAGIALLTLDQSALAAAPTGTPEEGIVYTANEDGTISAVEVRTGQVTSVATRITPHNVQVSRDGRWLLAVGPLAEKSAAKAPMPMPAMGAMDRGRLLIFDTANLTAVPAADIEIGRHPAHVVMDAQGQRAYATNSEDNTVLVIDVVQKKVIGEIPTGAFPHGLRLSPTGRELYVANVNDNSVSVIDVAQAKAVARIPVGKAPVQVAFTPDGGRVYVSLRDENRVAVIDTGRREPIATVAVGRNPIQDFVTPDGRYVYVANQGTDAAPDNRVAVIATGTNAVVATIPTGKGAHGVVVSDDGTRTFIANIVDSTVSVIDTATQTVIRTIKVGEGPNGITFRGPMQ